MKNKRIPFLHQSNPNEVVEVGYFKTFLGLYELSKNGKRVVLIDAFGSRVLWAYKAKFGIGMVRFGSVVHKKGKPGFMVEGKFIQF